MSEYAEKKYTAEWPGAKGKRVTVDRYALSRLIDLMLADTSPEGSTEAFTTQGKIPG